MSRTPRTASTGSTSPSGQAGPGTSGAGVPIATVPSEGHRGSAGAGLPARPPARPPARLPAPVPRTPIEFSAGGPRDEAALDVLSRTLAGRRLHLVGIGGCGMSGLARLLAESGAIVDGCDRNVAAATALLAGAGVPIEPDDLDPAPAGRAEAVIRSAAIADDHPRLVCARAAGVPVLSYAEALGRVQAERTGVSIAGTHGKSTTSAMLCHVLQSCGLDPGFVVGARCPQLGGGSAVGAPAIPHGPLAGRPGILVAEACEFRRSFHHHRPRLALVNNLEADHLDVYASLDEIVEAFHDFARRLPPESDGGYLLIAHEGAHRREVTSGLACGVRTFGFSPGADHHVQVGPGLDERTGSATITITSREGGPECRFVAPMSGEHNALNAAAAVLLACRLGTDPDEAARAIAGFAGLDRRMQRVGERTAPGGAGRVVVYDDYGHHPTEIDLTLRALRASERPDRLVCVFQPHQHSRTRFLLDEFAASFEAADVVVVPRIYFVRDSEQERQLVDAVDLVERLRERGVVALHVHPFPAIVDQLEMTCRDGDLVAVMGAGPVGEIAWDFLRAGASPRGASDAEPE